MLMKDDFSEDLSAALATKTPVILNTEQWSLDPMEILKTPCNIIDRNTY